MDDASPAHVMISPEAFLTLKRLNNEFEEVIETIEILNTPQLMKQIERSKKDVKAGRVCEITGADDLGQHLGMTCRSRIPTSSAGESEKSGIKPCRGKPGISQEKIIDNPDAGKPLEL